MAGQAAAALRTGVILAGGFDAHLATGASRLPVLAPIANKPLVCYALESLASAGIEEVAIVVSPDSRDEIGEIVTDGAGFGVRVVYVEQTKPPGHAQALLAAAEFVEGRAFVVHRGDGLFRSSLRPLVEEFERAELDALVLLQGAGTAQSHLFAAVEGGDAKLMVTRRASVRSGRALAGVQAFGPRFLDAMRELTPSPRDRLEMADAADRLAAIGGRVVTRAGQWWWSCDGSPRELLRTNRLVLDELHGEVSGGDRLDSRVEGRVVSDPSATVAMSTIRGPAIIGPHACLSHAYVGPFTSIGSGVVIEGAEIEDSIIFPDVVVRHLGRRLEGSVVGRKAKLHRDFSVPAALRMWVGDNVEVSLG
jgi:glucose-1-phosphate thymidylyltransferase